MGSLIFVGVCVFRFQAPVRDEESESQRKARSRLMRQSRRSTQVWPSNLDRQLFLLACLHQLATILISMLNMLSWMAVTVSKRVTNHVCRAGVNKWLFLTFWSKSFYCRGSNELSCGHGWGNVISPALGQTDNNTELGIRSLQSFDSHSLTD